MDKVGLVTPSFVDGKFVLNTEYVNYVKNSGLVPMMITPENKDVLLNTFPNAVLVLTGGADISPTLFGDNNEASNYVNEDRDVFELSLLDYFLGKKAFGICRGLQLMYRWLEREKLVPNHYWYEQHIGNHNQGDKNVPGRFPFHYVFYRSGNRQAVNSFHHQAVATVTNSANKLPFAETKEGFVPICYSTQEFSKDCHNLEAFRFLEWLAVQWHPERLVSDNALRDLAYD